MHTHDDNAQCTMHSSQRPNGTGQFSTATVIAAELSDERFRQGWLPRMWEYGKGPNYRLEIFNAIDLGAGEQRQALI